MSDGDKIQVVIRVRPLIPRDVSQVSCVQVNEHQLQIRETTGNALFDEYQTGYTFNFDWICGPEATQDEVFMRVSPVLEAFTAGESGTIMCYGVTSSGKSYTMFNGIVPRVSERLEGLMEGGAVSCTCLQIYNEQVYDLFGGEGQQIRIVQVSGRPVEVQGASVCVARSGEELAEALVVAERRRRTAQTRYNDLSSRSHVVLTLTLRDGAARLHLVDLAGSERLSTDIRSTAGQETRYINRSLQTLNLVVRQLSSGSDFVSYRDSALTRLLSDALGGPARAAIVVTISPCAAHYHETLNTLRFAERAKRVPRRPFAAAPATADPVAPLREELARLTALYAATAVPRPEYARELQARVLQLEQVLTLGGVVQLAAPGDIASVVHDVAAATHRLSAALDRERDQHTTTVQQFRHNIQSQEKFKLVISKQQENAEYLLNQLNRFNNVFMSKCLEYEMEVRTRQQNILLAKNDILTRNRRENVRGNIAEQEEDAIIINMEAEVNQLEVSNQMAKDRVNRARRYLQDLRAMEGQNLIQAIQKQSTVQQMNPSEIENIIQYFKEQSALINIIKQKIMLLLDRGNMGNLEKLLVQVLEALRGSFN